MLDREPLKGSRLKVPKPRQAQGAIVIVAPKEGIASSVVRVRELPL
jgi:hypothetical protein